MSKLDSDFMSDLVGFDTPANVPAHITYVSITSTYQVLRYTKKKNLFYKCDIKSAGKF